MTAAKKWRERKRRVVYAAGKKKEKKKQVIKSALYSIEEEREEETRLSKRNHTPLPGMYHKIITIFLPSIVIFGSKIKGDFQRRRK